MLDAVFIVSGALVSPPGLSIYTTEDRYLQTIETLNSIDKYMPNSSKILFDASSTLPEEKYFEELHGKGINILYTGNDANVKLFSQNGLKSPAEALSFLITLDWLKKSDIKAKRVYKISGRYRLNDNFVSGLEHINKYVFTVPTKTWMSEDRIKHTGVDHVYQSRLFHFDFDLLDQTIEILPKLIKDCLELGIDIEHGYYKHFNEYKPIEMPLIGVCGNLAPNGEYVDE